MSSWCLLKEQADKFIIAVREGKIDPLKMVEMSSEKRRNYLSDIIGKENAVEANALFESKLLLKSQKVGLDNWVKRVSKGNSQVRQDLISKISKIEEILNPNDTHGQLTLFDLESKPFLQDLASTKVGANITEQEAKNIFDLSQKVQKAQALQKKDMTFDSETQRLEFGRAKVALGNYVNDLKGNNKITLKSVADIGGITKSIRASMDNSAIFRQGWKTLMTNPLIWQKNARQSFVDLVKTFGGKKVLDEVQADIISRSNYDLMKKAKLAVSGVEEAFPTTIPEKIPVLGRAYKASEAAYNGFVQRQRADIFDKYIQVAKGSGVELTDKELQSIGSMVNSLTGRGNLGKYEPAANLVNNVFFSPRFIKSQIDTLLHPVTGAGGSKFVRKQAAINLVKVLSGTAGVLATANAIMPGSVEFDPRSADFGKIKVGNTRFDVTGGMSSLATLAARLATMSSKSSTTGTVTPLNSGKYGSQTGNDVVINFLENKLSPIGSVVKDLLVGQDFKGNKPTVGGELANLFVPLSASTYQDLKNDPHSANTILAMIADGLGIATNTYSAKPKTPTPSTAGVKRKLR
jgi:hypothetical protein